jgi:hypothetical protein
MAHTLPQALIEFAERVGWPVRIPGDLFAWAVPGMKGSFYEFLPMSEVLRQCRKEWTESELIAARNPATQPRQLPVFLRTYLGANDNGPNDLPWLDKTQAVYVAGSTEYGEDTSIALDYRCSPTEPRVAVNGFQEYGPDYMPVLDGVEISWTKEVPKVFEDAAAPKTLIEELTHPAGNRARFYSTVTGWPCHTYWFELAPTVADFLSVIEGHTIPVPATL